MRTAKPTLYPSEAQRLQGKRPTHKNYKGEKFPNSIELLTSTIIQSCKSASKRGSSFSIWDIYSQSDGKTKSNRAFPKKAPHLLPPGTKEIKGLYLLSRANGGAFYVGISQTILRRLKQHFFSPYSNQSSLVYLMSHDQFKKKNGRAFDGLRKDFPFRKYSPEIQKELRDTTEIRIVPIQDNFELYLSEIVYSSYFKTYWNSFETH
jgi:predicted GIY-YIG superfamily endonuclease